MQVSEPYPVQLKHAGGQRQVRTRVLQQRPRPEARVPSPKTRNFHPERFVEAVATQVVRDRAVPVPMFQCP